MGTNGLGRVAGVMNRLNGGVLSLFLVFYKTNW